MNEAMKKYRKTEKFKNWQKAYRAKRRLDPDYVEKLKQQKKSSFRKNYKHNLWKRTKDRALKKGIEFTLLEENLIIPEKCPILGILLEVGTKENYENTPTIDRIDNSKGYTEENCRVISMKANTMKNNASVEELRTFYSNIFKYLQNEDIV